MINKNDIVELVATAKGYQGIDAALIARIAEQEIKNTKWKQEVVVKRVKQKLHQYYGAFNKQVNFEKIFHAVTVAHATGDPKKYRESLYSAMQAHASSGERMLFLQEFYERIFHITGQPQRILDLACGLNPLSILALDFPKTIVYTATDVGQREVDFLNRVFQFGGYTHAHAEQNDLLTAVPAVKADVAFLLKTVPTLERQQTGSGVEVIEKIHARYVVVSFATKNLGRVKKQKNMKQFYQDQFFAMTQEHPWHIEQIDFPNELVFVVKKSNV